MNSGNAKAPRELKGAKNTQNEQPDIITSVDALSGHPFAPFSSLGALAFCCSDDDETSIKVISREELSMIPATQHGIVAHNMLNAALAWAIAQELGFSAEARAALLRFGADPRDNMGRMMVLPLADVTVVVDYAHNPQSVAALIDGTRAMPATRRAVTLGTGGDRDDVALDDIAGAAVESGLIDLYIAKEMPRFLRGRPEGSISGVLLEALRRRGVPAAQCISAPSDMAAARLALAWARTGDLILLATHDDRAAILALLDDLVTHGWRAGEALPEA